MNIRCSLSHIILLGILQEFFDVKLTLTKNFGRQYCQAFSMHISVNLKATLHKVCKNTIFHWSVFSHIRTESTIAGQ